MKQANLASIISKRLRFNKGKSFSGIVIGVAKGTIALGLAILVVSVLIYAGFISEIQSKIFSVSGHLSIRQFTAGTLYEEQPLEENQ
ncbi:MAG TPA: ABC transporter permease, partial [Catalimonadaceae bacterium]|nr:ABC transporter permease [Catalimonadaceae bacterium]